MGLSGSRSNRAPDGHSFVRNDEGKVAIAVKKETKSETAASESVEVDLDVDGGIFSIVDDKKAVPWTSRCTKVNGGHIDIKYDPRNFKKVYRDEYTNEILPQKLVVEAIREELNDFNNTVWNLAEPSDTRKLQDAKTVRSKWVLCNNGDAESQTYEQGWWRAKSTLQARKKIPSSHQPPPLGG